MYIPTSFSQSDLPTLHAAIERYSFATLISLSGGLTASHLPLLVDRDAGRYGTLIGHMARANLQWLSAAQHQVLAIFHGPHAYISPRWYDAPLVVPTWNYVAVHAYGQLELIDAPDQTILVLRQMVDHFESSLPEPWQLDEPAEFVDRLAAQIVAFRIPIDRLEGKWKLSQNQSVDRRERVMEALACQEDENSREIAAFMRPNDSK
jgi:transcriptional regulator